MKKELLKLKENKNGITLIALVITIIVLLILVGVTITTLTEDNGLLGKTSESKFITEIQHYNEELKLAITEDYTNSMGNRQNKFNIRRNSYNDENSFIDAMKTKIPSFNNKYANKLEIKEDKLNYIGDDEQERTWLAQVISVAGMLKINYVYENGTEAAPTYQRVIADGSYEVKSPKKDGYEPDQYIVSGQINGDINITVTYYPPSQGLEYELLDDETYTVAGIGGFVGEGLVIPVEYNGKAVTKIKESAFKNNTTIKTIIISNNITDIGIKAFENCKHVEYINLNAKKTSGMDNFARCSNLKKIEIGKNVESFGNYCFIDCKKLFEVVLYSENVRINSRHFSGCEKLEHIYVPENNLEYKEEDGALYSKDGKKLYFYIPGKKQNITINSEVEEICGAAFYSNLNITQIDIPSNVETIGADAFKECRNLLSLKLNAQKIESNDGFAQCKQLKKIEIGENVKSIGNYCFIDCKSVEEVIYKGTIEQWNNLYKSSTWNYNSNITAVICTDGTVDA